MTGAGVAGAALITSIVAPVPAAAQSPNGCGPCTEEARSCSSSEEDNCFCFNTTEGPQCISTQIQSYAGECSQQGGCPEGSFCIEGETEGECQSNNGTCRYACGQVPEI